MFNWAIKQRIMLLLIIFVIFIASVRAQSASEAQIQRLAQEGGQALAEQRYADAEKAYEKLRQIAPAIAEVHAQLGLAYFQQGKFAQAVPSFQQALKLKPALPNLDVLLAMSQSELGNYNAALPVLQKGFKRTSDAVLKRSIGLQLQRAYTGLQQDDKAVETALELTQLYPKDAEILYHASRIFANQAYLAAVKLSQVAPDSLWLSLAAGEAYESQGQFDAALNSYREVLQRDPNRPGMHFRLGRVLLARARAATNDTTSEPEALKEFQQELQLDSTNANAAYEAGELERKAAQFDNALVLFSQAIKYYPDFEDALVGLGRTLINLNRAGEALKPLQKAAAMNAQNEVTWYQLSLVHKSLGNAAEQQKSLAEFQRLRTQKAQTNNANFSRSEVTKQKLDATVAQ